MRYSFLALIVLSLALIGQPVQGAVSPRAGSTITPTPAVSGIASVPLPRRAIARLGQGSIDVVEVSPDSKRIAIGGSVGVIVYAAATLKALWSARGEVKVMKWSPDSALLAADVSGVSVWNGATGRLAYRLKDYFPNSLDWSPDGKRLIMASSGGLGMIWYLKAGTPPIRLVPPTQCDPDTGWCIYYMHAALSPDGRLYATTYERGAGDVGGLAQGVVIWDALTGVQKRVLPTWGYRMKWLRDSQHLLVKDEGKVLTEWDAKTGQQVDISSVINRDPTPEDSFHLPSGELVTWEYSYSDLTPRLVDVQTAAVLCEGNTFISPDFKLCGYLNTSDVTLSQLTNDTEVLRIEDVSGVAAFSPDWKFLVGWSASSPDDLNVWKIADGQVLGRLALRSHPLNSVAWSPDGHRLAIVDDLANVQLWDAVTGQFVQDLPNPAAPGPSRILMRAAFSPDGSRLAVSGIKDTLLVIWDMASGQPVAQTDIADPSFDFSAGMIWSPDGTEIALAGIALVSEHRQVVVVDAATGQIRRSRAANADSACFGDANGINWSPDGKQIAVGSCGEIVLYDATTLNKVSTLTYQTRAQLDNTMPYLAYSPDGRSLAAVIPLPDQYILTIWNLPSGQVRIGRITSNSPEMLVPLSSMTWAPNGRVLAVGFGTTMILLGGFSVSGGDIAIFSAQTSQQVALLSGHTNDADGISFSPDGKYLASASLDGTVLIWDLTGL